MKNRLAFIKIGAFSHVNDQIIRLLAEHFPDLHIDIIDVRNLVSSHKALVLTNMFFVFKEYGREILLGRKKIRDCFWRTPYLFNKIKTLLAGRLAKGEYAFSFQTQSLFDASQPGLPHYVYTDHTHLVNLRYPGFKRQDLYSARWIGLEKSIYHHATLNFTMGEHAAKSIIEDYSCPPEKVACVYVGSNTGTDYQENKTKYNSKNILFVGIDWERKGGPELVAAFKLAQKVHPDARLTIVGCSPHLDIPNCTVAGRVPLEEVNRYYEEACVFCLPTRLEPFGIVFLEAFAHGLPVVATDIGTIPGFVINGETGYLVRPGDVEQIAKVLIELLNDPEKCREMGENGRRLVLEKYNWQKVGAEMGKYIKATMKP